MSGTATLRGSEAKFEFCKENEKNYLVKSEYFRWFYDQIPSLVKNSKKKNFPLIFEILFSSETSKNLQKKNLWNISCLKKLSQNLKNSPCAAEALANFFLGRIYSDQTLKKKKKKKKN